MAELEVRMEGEWEHSHLHDVTSLTKNDVEKVLSLTERYFTLNRDGKKEHSILKGKDVLLFFMENSTRTRNSFDIAAQRLGARTFSVQKLGSSMQKGETLRDTIYTLHAMRPDAIVMRSEYSGATEYVAQYVNVPVLNAGDGWHAHPTQALLDLFVLFRAWKGDFSNRVVAIVGDTKHSRVARSNIHLLQKFGVAVRVCSPPTLCLHKEAFPGVLFFDDVTKAVEGVDAIIALRLQFERQEAGLVPREYYTVYGIQPSIVQHAKNTVVVLHPGPINPALDIDASFGDGTGHSKILEQVESGVATRMALLTLFLS